MRKAAVIKRGRRSRAAGSPPVRVTPAVRHTQRGKNVQKLLKTSRRVAGDTSIYRPLGDSRLLFNYAFNILSEESSLMCLIKALPWGRDLIMFLLKKNEKKSLERIDIWRSQLVPAEGRFSWELPKISFFNLGQ